MPITLICKTLCPQNVRILNVSCVFSYSVTLTEETPPLWVHCSSVVTAWFECKVTTSCCQCFSERTGDLCSWGFDQESSPKFMKMCASTHAHTRAHTYTHMHTHILQHSLKGSSFSVARFEWSWPREHGARLPQVPCSSMEVVSWSFSVTDEKSTKLRQLLAKSAVKLYSPQRLSDEILARGWWKLVIWSVNRLHKVFNLLVQWFSMCGSLSL